jgi:hypothetical protein
MSAMTRIAMVGMIAVAILSGCQSMPWQKKEPMPPVELLSDTPKADAPVGAPPTQAPTAEAAKPSGLELSTNQRFKDVPLPAKAKEDPERSYVYESAKLQIGRMVYNIHADPNDIANFYIAESPAAGWKLDNAQQALGNTYLLFTKPGKRLEVTVQPLGMGRGERLILHMIPDGPSGV